MEGEASSVAVSSAIELVDFGIWISIGSGLKPLNCHAIATSADKESAQTQHDKSY